MNALELIQSYFGGEHGAQLGQAAGLDADTARRALEVGLPMQMRSLAEHVGTPGGQAQVQEAMDNLPRFGSVHEALSAPEGAGTLQQAGELLGPVLLGSGAHAAVTAASQQTGAPPEGIGRLFQMALPLLLSFLGQRGGAGGLGALLGGLGGMGAGLAGAAAGLGGGASVRDVALSGDTPTMGSAGGSPVVPSMGQAASSGASTSVPHTPEGLLDFFRAQFSGATAERIGAAAGFSGSSAGRAALGALPLVLGAVAAKGRTEAGAAEVLRMAQPYSALSDETGALHTGTLHTGTLSDPAELGRVETQGRGLLGGLFGNVEEISGRLGTALGGSGAGAGRLLALMAPLVLSVLGGRARAGGLSAGGLSGLLGGLSGQLSSLLPAGMGGLGALISGLGAAGTSTTVAAAVPTPAPAPAAPRTTTVAATPVPASSVTTEERRRGLPLWLIPLLLLLLVGGCLFLRPRDAATGTTTGGAATTGTETTGTDSAATGTDAAGTDTSAGAGTDTAGTSAAGGFAIQEPAADATLPAGGFTMRGTGTAGEVLAIQEDGTSLGNVTVGQDGTWSFDVPSPAAGARTYRVNAPDGTQQGTLAVTIGAPAAGASATNCTEPYTLSLTDGQTVSEPFRFGGKGEGQGYSVTVRRGDRTIGVKNIPLDASCGWSYQSRPGAGPITYEVRPLGNASAEPVSTVNITVQ